MFAIFNIYVITIIVVVIILLNHVRRRYNHPPGPLGLPYVGLLPWQAVQALFPNLFPKISQKAYYRQMRQKYGDFWSVEIGSQRIITLASFDIVNEAFSQNGKIFCGKPINDTFTMISEGQGILLIDGELWKDNRQMAIRAFHDMGVGKTDMENHISDEANSLVEHLEIISKSQTSGPVEFIYAESNVISRLLFNEANKYDDPEFEVFLKELKCAYQSDVIDTKCNFLPSSLKTNFARSVFPEVDKYFKAWANITAFVTRKCQKRKGNQSEVGPTCVFDYFWKYRYEDDPTTKCEAKMLEISHAMSDLYTAGTDTANTLLRFCCLMLGLHPEVQKDLRNEIKISTDNYKHINMEMKKNCPKLLSFIDEIHRFCCLLPKFHNRVMKPCTFRGYRLYPEDIIIGDWGTISRDSTLFQNPDTFDAYRFMDKSRTRHVPNRYLIPFGIGRRSCLGESIASMELFLFISRLILAFEIALPNKTVEDFDNIFDGRSGLIHAPLDHAIDLHFITPL